ncbi:MAG: isocitrate lyase/PEP mutase family protein [Mycobacteriaceae bacterium]
MSDLLGPRPNPRARLRELLAHPGLLVPGAYDALSARLVAQAGFDAVYMTGFGTSATLLGRPDVGLLGGAEMADNARRMAAAVDVPLIADADTGYGNPVNVVRTVREYEQAGVAAIQLEDQVAPKRCGHMTGKEVIPTADMCAKIAAAVAARSDPDLVVIARTDVAETQGTAAAIERAREFRDAGADVLFVEAPRTVADIEQVAGELAGTPLLFNWVEGGRSSPISLDRVRELGFAMVIFPVSTLMAATAAMRGVLYQLRETGSTDGPGLHSFEEFLDVIGLPEVQAVEQRFRS